MAVIGFKLIRYNPSVGASYFNVPTGQVEYTPAIKYQFEKRNVYDPTIIHRRGEYNEDTLKLECILTPAEYLTLDTFLRGSGKLYVEYSHGIATRQFPVVVSAYPKSSDDLNEYSDKVEFSVVSRYVGTPGYIDFGTIVVQSNDDIVFSLA